MKYDTEHKVKYEVASLEHDTYSERDDIYYAGTIIAMAKRWHIMPNFYRNVYVNGIRIEQETARAQLLIMGIV